MNMRFERKLAIPAEVKEMYPLTGNMAKVKEERDLKLKSILAGRSDELILIIGPCSADREDSVIDYISRLRKVQEKVEEKIFIIPRIYTNKPRTTLVHSTWKSQLVTQVITMLVTSSMVLSMFFRSTSTTVH